MRLIAFAVIVVASSATLVLAQEDRFGAEEREEKDRYAAVIEELCKDRASNEYFRLSTESNCRDDGFTHAVTFLSVRLLACEKVVTLVLACMPAVLLFCGL